MDVILLERVEKLGAIGDVVKVKDGFARNFLLPRKKAMRANEANRKVFEANRARIESDNANRRGEAEVEAKTFKDASVTLIRQASNTGQLYGSVAVRDLVDILVAEGHKVPRSAIVLDKPIKAIGVYEVKVSLHPEVSVTVKVNVARSPEEAEMQASGVDVMASMYERDEAGFVEAYDPNAEPGATAEGGADGAEPAQA
ncbi:MAG: 50S ribosomal protein L9 [Janthinobacterium lividum]